MRTCVVTLSHWPDDACEPVLIYRVCERDGSPVRCWAPGLEPDDLEGDLDRGGFDQVSDAVAFALGVDRWRAEQGLLVQSVAEIDRERAKLDSSGKARRAPQPAMDFA